HSEPFFGEPEWQGREFAAGAARPARGARPDPGIIPVAPIGEVVPAFGAGSGVIGDFVGGQPASSEPFLRHLEQRSCALLVGQGEFAAPRERREGGTGLDRQLIEGQVFAGEGKRLVELAPPAGNALTGPCIEQIEREPAKYLAVMLARSERLLPTMA